MRCAVVSCGLLARLPVALTNFVRYPRRRLMLPHGLQLALQPASWRCVHACCVVGECSPAPSRDLEPKPGRAEPRESEKSAEQRSRPSSTSRSLGGVS